MFIILHQVLGTPLSKFTFVFSFFFGSTSAQFFLCSHCLLHSVTILFVIAFRSTFIISSTSFVFVLLLIIINSLNVPLHSRYRFSFCVVLGSYPSSTIAALNN